MAQGFSFSPSKRVFDLDTALTRAKRLDGQALAHLHDQYYPVVFRYVAFRLDDPQAQEDITADVFLNLAEALHQGKGKIQDVRAWLLGTASHLVSDHFRRKYRRPVDNLEDHTELPGEGTPEGQVEQSLHNRRVRTAMAHLTRDQQQVLALRFSQEYSLEETARVMGKTVGAVKVLQFRALESLRRLLEER